MINQRNLNCISARWINPTKTLAALLKFSLINQSISYNNSTLMNSNFKSISNLRGYFYERRFDILHLHASNVYKKMFPTNFTSTRTRSFEIATYQGTVRERLPKLKERIVKLFTNCALQLIRLN